jgi:hypothetical protein
MTLKQVVMVKGGAGCSTTAGERTDTHNTYCILFYDLIKNNIFIYIYIYHMYVCVDAYIQIILSYYFMSCYITLYLSLTHRQPGGEGSHNESLSPIGACTASGIDSQMPYFLLTYLSLPMSLTLKFLKF